VKTAVYEQYQESCRSKESNALDNHLFWPELKKLTKLQDKRETLNGSKVGVVKFEPLEECIKYFAITVLRMPDATMLQTWVDEDSVDEASELAAMEDAQ
jgi:hypothetical protein